MLSCQILKLILENINEASSTLLVKSSIKFGHREGILVAAHLRFKETIRDKEREKREAKTLDLRGVIERDEEMAMEEHQALYLYVLINYKHHVVPFEYPSRLYTHICLICIEKKIQGKMGALS